MGRWGGAAACCRRPGPPQPLIAGCRRGSRCLPHARDPVPERSTRGQQQQQGRWPAAIAPRAHLCEAAPVPATPPALRARSPARTPGFPALHFAPGRDQSPNAPATSRSGSSPRPIAWRAPREAPPPPPRAGPGREAAAVPPPHWAGAAPTGGIRNAVGSRAAAHAPPPAPRSPADWPRRPAHAVVIAPPPHQWRRGAARAAFKGAAAGGSGEEAHAWRGAERSGGAAVMAVVRPGVALSELALPVKASIKSQCGSSACAVKLTR